MSQALYRRYRPETFAEVIGQEHVTEPLQQALRTGRVSHAYLFSGPRGCGKTTSARILARCLNCEQGPTDVPCGECDSCRELGRGGSGSLDVVEIDAASHNGVDDARELRERAAFAPARDRFKIFILDEAHMVTPQGFNALLKIVEEPPAHVKFIFATTEPERVIGTIRSRTHHYPFRLVPPEKLTIYLAELCDKEHIEADAGVLPLVVRAGGGSVRDTESVLDQLMAGADDGTISYDGAIALLGYTPTALLDDVVEALGAVDGAAMFRIVERVIETGQDPRRFVEDVLERIRDLIVLAAAGDGAMAVLRSVSADQLDRMRRQALAIGLGMLSRAGDVVNAALSEMTGATSPRLQLELLAARLLVAMDPGSARPAADAGPQGAQSRRPESSAAERRPTASEAATPNAAMPGVGSIDQPGPQRPARILEQPPASVRPAAVAPQPVAAGSPDDAAPDIEVTDPVAPDVAAPVAPAPTTAASDIDAIASGAPTAGVGGGQPEGSGSAARLGRAAPGANQAPPADSQTPDAGPRPDRGTHPDAGVQPGDPADAPPWHEDEPGDAPSADAAHPQPSSHVSAPSIPAPREPAPGEPTSSEPAPSGAAAPPSGAPGSDGLATLQARWPEILDKLGRIRRASWVIVSQEGRLAAVSGTAVTLAFRSQGLAEAFRRGHLEALREAISQVTEMAVSIDVRLDGDDSGPGGGGGGARGTQPPARGSGSSAARPDGGLATRVTSGSPASSPVSPPSAGVRQDRGAGDAARSAVPSRPISTGGDEEPSEPPGWGETPPEPEGWDDAPLEPPDWARPSAANTGASVAARATTAPRGAVRSASAGAGAASAAAVATSSATLSGGSRPGEDDLPSEDDMELEGSGLIGAPLVARMLGGEIIDEIVDEG